MPLPSATSYKAPWTVYALAMSPSASRSMRFAVGSFQEFQDNKVQIVDYNAETMAFNPTVEFQHTHPATKVLFCPNDAGTASELLAVSGSNIQIWRVNNDFAAIQCALAPPTDGENAPLTSFDWNNIDTNIIVTASIDTTCTVWDINAQEARTQIQAHDQEVFDVTFGHSRHTFVSSSADGSVRLFDLRALEHSTVVYESPELVPLPRVAWNGCDANYIATFGARSCSAFIIDVRKSQNAVAELKSHTKWITDISWSPHTSSHLLTTSMDKNVLIWDLSSNPNEPNRVWPQTPVLRHEAPVGIQKAFWSTANKDLVAFAAGDCCTILQI